MLDILSKDSQGVVGETRDDISEGVDGEGYFPVLGVFKLLVLGRDGRSEFHAAAKARKEDFRVGLFSCESCGLEWPSEECKRCSEVDFLREQSLLLFVHIDLG